jgi:hypothetical protein
MLILNCGGFSGSHRQFGGVHASTLYTFLHIDKSPRLFTSISSRVEFGDVVSRSPFSFIGSVIAFVLSSKLYSRALVE